jgi:hypothetical protein
MQGVFGEGCRAAGGGGANPDGTHAPIVSMRRAGEEANGCRAWGFRAVAFHNGDGYYVSVSR